MINWIDVLANQERYEDMRREAQRERLVRQARPAPQKRGPVHGPARIWLGRRLVTWGSRLQESYGAASRDPRPSGCQSHPTSSQHVI